MLSSPVFPAVEESREPCTCGAGYVVMRSFKSVLRGGVMLGDNDINIGEISAILSALRSLKQRFYKSDRPETDVHIFTDSDTTMMMLTEPGRVSKYYRLVQRVRREASHMSKYNFIIHWIPSHLDKQFSEFEIHGNSIADKEAQSAALRGRESKYDHPEKGLDDLGVHKTIMSETARLVHDIQNLFPREHGPASMTCEVTSQSEVKPSGRSGVT